MFATAKGDTFAAAGGLVAALLGVPSSPESRRREKAVDVNVDVDGLCDRALAWAIDVRSTLSVRSREFSDEARILKPFAEGRL